MYEYAIVCVPVPAVAGSKLFPEIPGPLKVPPVGDPVNVTDAFAVQYPPLSPLKLTIGKAFTVTVVPGEVALQPLASVIVTL